MGKPLPVATPHTFSSPCQPLAWQQTNDGVEVTDTIGNAYPPPPIASCFNFMETPLEDRIHAWMNDEFDRPNSPPLFADKVGHATTRRRRDNDPSQNPDSPRKGRRCHKPPPGQAPSPPPTMSESSENRPRARGKSGLPHVDLPAPGALTASRRDSRSQSPPKRSKSQSPPKIASKPASPGKLSRQDLSYVEKKLEILGVDGTQSLPNDVQGLYDNLELAGFRQHIIPHEVKGIVGLQLPSSTPSFVYKDVDTPGAQRMWEDMSQVLGRAEQASAYGSHEPSWNNDVHWPVLNTVFDWRLRKPTLSRYEAPVDIPGPHATASMLCAMASQVYTAYVPNRMHELDEDALMEGGEDEEALESTATSTAQSTALSVAQSATSMSTRIQALAPVGESKKIDYLLLLNPSKWSPMQKAYNRIYHEAWKRNAYPHMNQCPHPTLQWSPIACSIETKAEWIAGDPMVQLAFWCSAWHKRMEVFRQQGLGTKDLRNRQRWSYDPVAVTVRRPPRQGRAPRTTRDVAELPLVGNSFHTIRSDSRQECRSLRCRTP